MTQPAAEVGYNKKAVVAQVIRQAKEDLGFGNTSQLSELLNTCPTSALMEYLSEERMKALQRDEAAYEQVSGTD